MENTTSYTVTGMSCSHCENAVQEEVLQIPGVESATVSASEGALDIHAADGAQVDDADVVAAVEEAGYHAQPTP